MRKSVFLLVVLTSLLLVGFACKPYDKISLGQEFTLAIGQKVKITGENLEINFKEVIEDSRCARDVTCVWEGRVVCLLEIIKAGVLNKITLTKPGITNQAAQESHQGYNFIFDVEPYPERADEPIKSSEYRLFLTISKD